MVNLYFYQLVLSQLVLFHWSTRTFLQLVLWSTHTFSLVSLYFSLVKSYFFFGQRHEVRVDQGKIKYEFIRYELTKVQVGKSTS